MRRLAALWCLALLGCRRRRHRRTRKLRAIVAPVSAAQMKATVEKLVSFGTRHTLSSQTDPKRGIGAALDWTRERNSSGFGLPTDAAVRHVHRRARAQRRRGLRHGRDPARHRAAQRRRHHHGPYRQPRDRHDERRPPTRPGANDDGSGTAAVIEAARVLSKHKFPGTIVYAALSGEEQGLLRRQGAGQLRQGAGLERRHRPQQRHHRQQLRRRTACAIDTHVRVLSEGPRWQGQDELAAQTHSLGGENDARRATSRASSTASPTG